MMLYQVITIIISIIILKLSMRFVNHLRLIESYIPNNKLIRVVLFIGLFSISIFFKTRVDRHLGLTAENVLNDTAYFIIFILLLYWIIMMIDKRSAS